MTEQRKEPALHSLNPFVPGAGRQPRELAGREKDLEMMDGFIAKTKLGMSNQGVIYRGLRGVGKTVLLMRCYQMAADKGLAVARMEASGDAARDYDALFQELAKVVFRVKDGDLRERLSDAMGRVRSVSMQFLSFKTEIGLSDANEEKGKLSDAYRLELIIEELSEELRKAGSGLFLFLDEMQELPPDLMGTLITIQHEMGQRDLPFYIIGAGLPNLPGLLTKCRSYAERLFDYREMGRVSRADAEDGFQKPARMMGRYFDDEALNRLVELSRGYPYFIQAYGSAAWNASASSPIGVEAVENGRPEAQAALDRGLYFTRWQKATPEGRAYLTAMAALGGEECDSSEVAKRQGKTTSELSMIRRALIEQGLIYPPAYGKVAFTVPGMGDFIRRSSPLEEMAYDRRDTEAE